MHTKSSVSHAKSPQFDGEATPAKKLRTSTGNCTGFSSFLCVGYLAVLIESVN